MSETLLVELLTEELPPKSLSSLGAAFSAALGRKLEEAGFIDDFDEEGSAEVIATPRRIAALLEGVKEIQPDQVMERKGPYVAAALDSEGKPTRALEGFAKACAVEIDALARGRDGKGEFFLFRTRKPGEPLERHLSGIVQEALRALPIAKLMRWGDGESQFVRPVHGLVMLHGSRLIPGNVLGLEARGFTCGHRFLGPGRIEIGHARSYLEVLRQRGKVIARFDERKARIVEQLHRAATGLGAHLPQDEALLEEVTALVEWPAVYAGSFDEAFLAVPQECLILSMKQHQKYFPLLTPEGKLLPRFLIVSNLETADPDNIVRGNERVLRARLADAKFFYDHDRKASLASRVPALAHVVYHGKLGSQLERVKRLQKLAGAIAGKLGADRELTERAAYLCKSDLLTDMVGEFPELQGIMGQHYARHDGEPEAVARAIEAHYHPRFANDTLPEDAIGACLALADKLDALVGIYGAGHVPSGDKDPFGLRRHALGILRILAEQALPLDLMELVELARGQFPGETLSDSVAADVYAFMLERLRYYLRAQGFELGEVEAVVSQNPRRIDQVPLRLAAVRAFRGLPEAESLAAANKRIQNILKKAAIPEGEPDPTLLKEEAEQSLAAATARLAPAVAALIRREDYTGALATLAQVRPEVDRFFDQVLVMAEDPRLRDNRLALLKRLADLMNQVADISKLAA